MELVHTSPNTSNLYQEINRLTVNIYSHLIGGLLFATLPLYVYITVYPCCAAKQGDPVVFSTLFFRVAVCFFLSALYDSYSCYPVPWLNSLCSFHIVANHSQRVAAFGNWLDYLGGFILMLGSTIPFCVLRILLRPESPKAILVSGSLLSFSSLSRPISES
jgi:predicted membrane channel-forming protein YqfA (hemolysin III family)